MRELTAIVVHHIVSEPGDLTRYDYAMYQDHSTFSIMPIKNTFPYPQQLDYWDVKHINSIEDAVKFIQLDKSSFLPLKVNPHTLLEVVNAIKEVYHE